MQRLEKTAIGTRLDLFLSKPPALEPASVLASFWCQWGLDAAIIVVVYVERGNILLGLSWTFGAELVASYSAQLLAGFWDQGDK